MIENMVAQIQQELEMLLISTSEEVKMNHIERAEKQLIDLRVYVYRQSHPSGTV